MDIEITNYHAAVEQSEDAMVQDYYYNQPPFKGAPAFIPLVPATEDGTPRVTAEACRFKYAELVMEDGESYLAIITPWTVSKGPGKRYRTEEY